jgi:hypothetical protein
VGRGGLWGEGGEYGASRSRACWERASRRTPCAERAVMAHSSPEPAAGLWGEGLDRRAGRAHFVRPESCDGSQQSRACGGLVGRGRVLRGPSGSSGLPGACLEGGSANSLALVDAEGVLCHEGGWRLGCDEEVGFCCGVVIFGDRVWSHRPANLSHADANFTCCPDQAEPLD